MSLSSIELWQRLAAEGLASPMQCRSWAGEVSKLLPAAETADGLKVLQKLIDIGKLTKYQAKVLAGQSSEPLKRGPWHVLSKVKQPLWQGWLEITKIDTSKGEQPPPRWARWLTAAELKSLQASAPSLPRGIQLANIQAEHLQTVEMPELIDGELQLQVHPVAGSSLAERFQSEMPSPDLALKIIQQTAIALAAMHQKQVVHGRVAPDRIFWDEVQGVTLVRDPISVWTAGVDPLMTGILGEHLQGLKVASFLAPEFLAPKQPPSAGSDIYALGATWWWLLVGKPPVEAKSMAATLGAAAEVTLDFEARLPHVPEPIRICLERCLAKNPSARIANAIQLSQALSAAVRSVAKGKVIRSKPVVAAAPAAAVAPQAVHQTSAAVASPAKQAAKPTAQAPTAQAAAVADSSKPPLPKAKAEKLEATASKPQKSIPPTVAAAPTVATPTVATPTVTTAPLIVAEAVEDSTQPASPVLVQNSQPELSQLEPIAAESAHKPIIATTTASSTQRPGSTATKVTSRRRTQRKSKMPLFIIAGFGFVALLLGILKLSGALESAVDPEVAKKDEPFTPPITTNEPKVITKDPMLERFRIVDSKEALWAPPALPEPVALDLLPPGAQLYVVLRPADLLTQRNSQTLLGALKKQFQLDMLLNQIASGTGLPLESIASVVVAYYSAASPEQFPASVMRVELVENLSLEQLKKKWKATGEAVVGQERLHLTDNDRAFFVPQDTASNAIKEFGVGPTPLMQETAELSGAAAPLNAQLKLLHSKSSRLNQLVFLGSPRYLFTDGRGISKQLPNRLQNLLEPVLSKDARAALLQVNFADRFYWELQLVGATDADTPRLISKLSDRATGAASEIENWFVSQTPHPYWRALAFRFPQMIRTWRDYARFGVEDGIALANGYLPADAAPNLLVASWIASQEASTMAGQLAESNKPTADAPAAMSPEDILNKPIRLSFDQEPIERALALVGDEANSGIPVASQLRFELDGSAFERAGITRNQQLREFKIDNQPARNALTEIAKRGNPVTTVKDTRELDQRLLWIVKDDPQNAGKKMISLTTREAAVAAGNSLPEEFAPR